jgi:acetylornithine deacetylase/succinyl-diaminopimelate desuccinylase-like protein
LSSFTLRRCNVISPNACRFRYNLALPSFFHAHYDGQPVDAAAWTHGKPFEPVLRGAKVVA